MSQESNPTAVLRRYRDHLRAHRGIGIRTFAAGFLEQYQKLVPIHEQSPMPTDADPTDRAEKLGDRMTRSLNPDDPRCTVSADWLPAWIQALNDYEQGLGDRALDEILAPIGMRAVDRANPHQDETEVRGGELMEQAGEAIQAMASVSSPGEKREAIDELEDVVRAARSAIEELRGDDSQQGQVRAVQ